MKRLLCPVVLFVVLFVPTIQGQKNQAIPTPEYYGVYALSGGKLVDLTSTKETNAVTVNIGHRLPVGVVLDKDSVTATKSLAVMVFGRDVKFLFYLQASKGDSPMNTAALLHITPLLFVRRVSVDTGWPSNVRRSGIENAWDDREPAEGGLATHQMESEVTLRIKPVPGHSDMVVSVPSEELAPGVYKLGLGATQGGYFAVGPVEKGQDSKCVDASYTYGSLIFSQTATTPCNESTAQPIPSTKTESTTKPNTTPSRSVEETTKPNTAPSDSTEETKKELSCSTYQECYKVAAQAYQKNDWVTARAGFRKAQGIDVDKPGTSASLGFVDLRSQEYDKVEADWNRALSLGGTLHLTVYHERRVASEYGVLSLSADTVTFTTGKDHIVFSVPTKDVVVESTGQPPGIRAHFFRIKADGKSYGFYFLAWWDTCAVQPPNVALVCSGVGYPQQKAVADYVMQALQKLHSGTLTKIKNPGETKP